MIKTIRNAALLLGALALPAGLLAQEPVPQPQPQPEVDEEVQAWFTELQQIQAELAPVHQQALQDPEIAAQQQALNETIHEAMREEDPQIEQTFERAEALQEEFQSAQEAGDQERLQQLSMEAQQIQTTVSQVQQAVLERDAISAQVEAFESTVRSKMIEIEPEAAELLDRLEELTDRIMTAMGEPEPPAR